MATLRLAGVGDIMCGDSFYAAGCGVASSLDRTGEFLSPALRELLAAHDIAFGNVECPLSNVGRKDNSLRTIHMRGRPEIAQKLREWGLTVVNVANNHILEHGPEAARDTVDHLRRAGLGVIGCGAGDLSPILHPWQGTFDGLQVTFAGICLRREKYAYDGGADLETVKSWAQEEASDGKTVVLSVHWGTEFMDYPSADQRRTARELLESGVTLLLGHHPHVVQGWERHGQGLIAYSLGNFIFDSFRPDCRWSIVLSATLGDQHVEAVDIHPVKLDEHHRPRLCEGRRADELRREVARRCSLLNSAQADDADYHAQFAARDHEFRRELHRRVLANCCRAPWRWAPQLLLRPLSRRIGLW